MTDAQLAMAVHLVVEHGRGIRAAARQFGLSEKVLREYVQHYKNKADR